MYKRNNQVSFFSSYIHLFILGGAFIASLSAILVMIRFDDGQLKAFGPTAQVYFMGIKNGLFTASSILFISLVSVFVFKKHIDRPTDYLHSLYSSLSPIKRNALILLACFVFSFASHAGNIMNGYFNMDDFEVMGLNHRISFSQSLLTPHGNDHTIPLFTAEMQILDTLFGQNEIAYNSFVFILFALIPFFTYLTFIRLGISISGFFVFLILFSGATNWAEMLTGFYIMSIYPQIILFFSITMWSHIAWVQTKEAKYMAFFTSSILLALAADTSGIWVLPATLTFMAYLYWDKHESFRIQRSDILKFLKENLTPLLLLFAATITFAIFFVFTFMVLQPNTFLSALSDTGISGASDKKEFWKILPLAENFLSFFSSGVSLSLIAPNIIKILVHPSIQNSVKSFWPFIEALIIAVNVMLLWFTLKYSSSKERKLIALLVALMILTISMVIVARPNHEIIPDFDYRYAGAPYYFYCILLALSASIFIKRNKAVLIKIVVSIVIVIFAAQQAFSFQAARTKEESSLRKEAVVKLNKNLLVELDILSRNNVPLTIPNLTGTHIFEQTMSGFTLADYILFFNKKMPILLVQNNKMPQDVKTHTVQTVSSIRSATSKEFIEALKTSPIIRSYYVSPGLMSYKIVSADNFAHTETSKQKKQGDVTVRQAAFDPEKMSTVGLTLFTDDISGNLEISFSFDSNFGIIDNIGKIRIDDYTPHIKKGGKRIYHIEADLLQIYTFALSEKVSNLYLHVPETKSACVSNFLFF